MSNTVRRHLAVSKATKTLRSAKARREQAQEAREKREAAVARGMERRAQVRPLLPVITNPYTGQVG